MKLKFDPKKLKAHSSDDGSVITIREAPIQYALPVNGGSGTTAKKDPPEESPFEGPLLFRLDLLRV